MNRREIIKQGSVLGFLGGLVGINAIPTNSEINKDKLLELFAKTQGKTVSDALCDKLITEDEAKLIIEHTQNVLHAYELVSKNESNKEWAEKIIENATIGDPAWAAYLMVAHCKSSREWAEGVIEQTTCGNPAYATCLMVNYGSSREWAEKIKAKHAKA